MESVEVSARSVEEAVQQALIRLGRNRNEVDVVVLSEGHRGILGFVRGESARVRVSVRKPPSMASRRTAEAPVGGAAVAVAQELLEELLDRMGVAASVVYGGGTGDDESPILLDVVGRDLGILIGRRGETLASLQFLLNVMVGKRLGSWARVLIDVEGYRARREESLRSLASRVAERVRRSGQPFALEPMPANERRIVHLALQDNPYVTTESSGYGEDRRVTIMPRSRKTARPGS